MTEVAIEVKPFRINMICDKCGAGLMMPTGRARGQQPNIEYEHKCNHMLCGEVVILNRVYPHVEFRDIPVV